MSKNIFDFAADLESSVEAELEELYSEREELERRYKAINESRELLSLKEMIKQDVPSQENIDKYVSLLGELVDIVKAMAIADRNIILLETGYDPGEIEELPTDMEIPSYGFEENERDE